MAKLTGKDRRALAWVLQNLERAAAYLMDERVAVARTDRMASTTLHYTRPADGRILYEVEKRYGSDLVALPSAIQGLKAFLETR